MTTSAKAPAPTTPVETGETRKFTVDEYYRMAEVGILSPKDRIELIRGEIVLMDRITPRHASCKMRMSRVFHLTLGMNAFISVAHPLRLDEYSEPAPDIAILRLREDEYFTGHPGPADTLIAVEISDISLNYDRNIKVNLYAEAGIPETWIVNLLDYRMEVFSDPGTNGYTRHAVYHRGDRIYPSTLPDVEFAVDDLLPPLPAAAQQTAESAT